MNLIVLSLITLGVIGCFAAVVLYFVAQKFKVEEDPRIDLVSDILPAANCGGCGFPGCKGFAEVCVKSDTLEGLNCPVGGAAIMTQVAEILGRTVQATDPMIAVVRCNGTCQNRTKTSQYDGAASCKIAANLYGGDTDCSFGCFGLNDCGIACSFNAIQINAITGLAEIDEEKCTACGACVKVCPKNIIELRKKGPKSRRIFVSCVNKNKGAAARKACSAACIGCSKCVKECAFDAIVVENNLAYIDYTKCRLCRKCVIACPTNAITELNFPPRKIESTTPKPTPPPTVEKLVVSAADSSTQTEPAALDTSMDEKVARVTDALIVQQVIAETAEVEAPKTEETK